MFVLLLVFPLFVFEDELFAPLLLLLVFVLFPLSSVPLFPVFPTVFPVQALLPPLPLPPLTGKENASLKGA